MGFSIASWWFSKRAAKHAVSGILALAGVLKILALTGGSAPPSLSVPQLFVLVSVEFALSAWLLTEWRPYASSLVAGGLFCVFAIYNSYLLATGFARCDCFGEVSISAASMLVIDLLCAFALALGLLNSHSRKHAERSNRRLPLISNISACVAFIMLVASMTSTFAQQLGLGPTILVDAKLLEDNQIRILEYIDIGAELGEGDWELQFVRRGCPDCQALLDGEHTFINAMNTVFVEVPVPGGESLRQSLPSHAAAGIRWGTLDAARDWIFPTPLTVKLRNGAVQQVFQHRHRMGG
jgi:hypothetical protein